MNKHYILSLFDPSVRTVSASFHGGSRSYTYKTTLDFEVGDLALVETPDNGVQAVTIRKVHVTPEIDADSNIDYKWIISKVDLAPYRALVDRDTELSAKVKEAQRDHHREAARAALLAKIPSLGALANLTEQKPQPLSNGLFIDAHGAFYHSQLKTDKLCGPFESVKEAMTHWTANPSASTGGMAMH